MVLGLTAHLSAVPALAVNFDLEAVAMGSPPTPDFTGD